MRTQGILDFGTALYVVGAGAFMASFVIFGGWTSANREGLHSFNGTRHRELRWSDVKQISRKRLTIRATTQDGRTVPLPGVNQARLEELTGIWTYYRDADGPQQALTHDVRHGLWPVDPSRRFRMPGAVLSMVTLIVGIFVALVVGLAIILSAENVVWAMIAVLVTLFVFLIPPIRMTMAGTTMTSEGLKVRLPWSTRTMTWQDVQQIIGAGEYTGVVCRHGTRSILYGVPVKQWQLVEGMRAQAMQPEASR